MIPFNNKVSLRNQLAFFFVEPCSLGIPWVVRVMSVLTSTIAFQPLAIHEPDLYTLFPLRFQLIKIPSDVIPAKNSIQ
jgi:hypothetical protein